MADALYTMMTPNSASSVATAKRIQSVRSFFAIFDYEFFGLGTVGHFSKPYYFLFKNRSPFIKAAKHIKTGAGRSK